MFKLTNPVEGYDYDDFGYYDSREDAEYEANVGRNLGFAVEVVEA